MPVRVWRVEEGVGSGGGGGEWRRRWGVEEVVEMYPDQYPFRMAFDRLLAVPSLHSFRTSPPSQSLPLSLNPHLLSLTFPSTHTAVPSLCLLHTVCVQYVDKFLHSRQGSLHFDHPCYWEEDLCQ